jgi:UDP:flavonoid glycosyltransferase YjiC (YdhE family)
MKRIWDIGRRESLRWVKPVLDLRREIGLPAGRHPIFEGSHSPSLVLALFSHWLAEPQPDWPPNTIVTGFPFFDRDPEQRSLSPGLERFFNEGSPPIVFTLGSSAVGAAGDFYRQSLAATQRVGGRAIFLTGPHPQGLPETLPHGMMAVPYAPHSEVFPRAAAIVHQGGIGTTAQAIRSGRPQLIIPFAHDQYDNAERVRRLGAGEVLYSNRYTGRRAAAHLRRLLGNPAYAAGAHRAGERVNAENGAQAAADAIEDFLRKRS